MELNRLFYLLMLLVLIPSAQAQIYRRTADGGDSVQTNIVFTTDKLHNMQHQIQYKMGDSTYELLPTDDVIGVKIDSKAFMNVLVQQPDGQTVRMFAHRLQAADLLPALYRIYDEQDKPSTYVQIGNGILTPVQTRPIVPDDALHRELLRLNDSLGGDVQIAHYLRKLKPTKRDLKEARKIMKSQNHNLITRLRWGVGIGMTYNMLSAEAMKYFSTAGEQTYKLDPVNQMQPTVSLFADIPSGNGLSLHPELTFRQASLHQTAVWNGNHQEIVKNGSTTEEVYNYTMIELPMMLRYTHIRLRSQWLPYAEAGLHFAYLIRNEHETREYVYDENGYFSSFDVTSSKGSNILMQFAAGTGIEYRYGERHAAFLGLRYVFTPAYDPSKTLSVKQQAMMINLSFNL